MTITTKEIGKIMDNARPKVEMVGNWELAKAVNLLARTLYMEARGEGIEGIEMAMTVIWNRAGNGIREYFVGECLRPLQFSCWNNRPSSEKNPRTY